VRVERGSGASPLPGATGSVLIEVMVAIVIAALLIVPLASGIQSALGRSDRVRAQMEQVGGSVSRSRALEGWEWGAMVTSAAWQPGPELRVEVERSEDAGLALGLWADGWFLGEERANADGSVDLRPSFWSGMTGCELVVRARESGGEWGPPWRTVVPDAYGAIPADAMAGSSVGTAGAGAGGLGVVAHSRSLATPLVVLSWAAGSVEAGALGLPFFLPLVSSGVAEAAVEGHEQSWLTDAGRAVDLYF
jgi:hypothetical protein